MALIVVVIVALLFLNANSNLPSNTTPENNVIDETEESGPWGSKVYSWEYKNTTYSIETYITRDEYESYLTGVPGTTYPDDLAEYVSVNQETISELAWQLEQIISQNDYSDDEDIAGIVLSFVSSINYQTDQESGHTSAYPRTPAITLAEEVGDSEDHSILAAALMNEIGYRAAIMYYPATYDRLSLIPEAAALGLDTGYIQSAPVTYVTRENSTETAGVSPFWTVDTETQGIPTAAYDGITPIIYLDEQFWEKKSYSPFSGNILDLSTDLHLKDSNGLFYTPEPWQQNVSDYYEPVWYETGIVWEMNDKWKIYEEMISIADVPAELYTPKGTAIHNATSPWRLSFKIRDMDEERAADMTPYSDVRIAIYSLDPSSGNTHLLKVCGWEGLYSADIYQTFGPFTPGTYLIGVLVRNAEVDVLIELHGKKIDTEYQGGI